LRNRKGSARPAHGNALASLGGAGRERFGSHHVRRARCARGAARRDGEDGVSRAVSIAPEEQPALEQSARLPDIPDGVWWTITEDFYKPVDFDRWPARHWVTAKLNDRTTEKVLRAIALRIKAHEEGPCKETQIRFLVPDSVGTMSWATALFRPDLKVYIEGLTDEQNHRLRTSPLRLPHGSVLLGCWLVKDGVASTKIAIYERHGRFFQDLTQEGATDLSWVEMIELPFNEGRVFRIPLTGT
jgi:hypothetical protein